MRDDYAYFVTCVTNHRIQLFAQPQYAEIVIANLDHYRKTKDYLLLGFVLMPDHYHAIIKPNDRYSAGEIVRDCNKYIAREIIQLAQTRNDGMIEGLSRCKVARPTRRHQVWRESPWTEVIYSEKFFRQKLNYIHLNPVRKQLAENPAEYQLSSFRSLYLGDHRPLEVDRYQFNRQ
jgi:putative transposase